MNTTAWRRIRRLLLISGAIPSLIALLLIWGAPGVVSSSPAVRWTLTLIVVLAWLGLGSFVLDRLTERLRTFGNLVAALREHDYTVRAAGARADDPLGEIAAELNELAGELRDRRLVRHESEALLETVLAQIDAAIFAFDDRERLRLVNVAGARLLSREPARLIGVSARALGLAGLLQGDTPRVEAFSLPGRPARCEIRRTVFRQDGRPHQLVVVNDLSRTLAAEERLAWKRLLQVLRHEINNSLAPIRSISATLRAKLARTPRPPDVERDLADGLGVIGSRAESLERLTTAYAKLTRLPAPRPTAVDLRATVQRVVALEHRAPVELTGGPAVEVMADPDQLEQVLINLVANAVDAANETDGGVRVGWSPVAADRREVELTIEDDGPGLADSENLFVPFFTTKPEGSGIGLVLSRQIVEAHGGQLELENRTDGRGCRARLRLPLPATGD